MTVNRIEAPAGLLAQVLITACLLASPGVGAQCTPYVEEHPTWSSATLRPHSSAFEHCEVSEAAYRQVVTDWLRARPPEAPPIVSLSLGRAVAFPWISRYLADSALQSPNWAARVRETRAGERDQLAATLLSDPSLLQRLAVPFEETQYLVLGVTFEKVLFGRADQYASDRGAGALKVPFDAQLWLRLGTRSSSASCD